MFLKSNLMQTLCRWCEMATLEVKIISLQRIVDHDPGCSQTGSPPHPKSGSGKLTRLQHGNGVITASVNLPPHKLLFYDKTSLKGQIGLMVVNIRIARPRNALWRAILMHQQSTLDIFFLHKKRKALICSGVDQSWGEHQPQEHSREHSSEFGKDVTCLNLTNIFVSLAQVQPSHGGDYPRRKWSPGLQLASPFHDKRG